MAKKPIKISAGTKAQVAHAATSRPQFPMGDKQYRIDASFQEPRLYKVFYWAERPDTRFRRDDDKFHWHPDSEHQTLDAAQARMVELRGGAKKRSIMRTRKET
jgi:hypothetical protein